MDKDEAHPRFAKGEESGSIPRHADRPEKPAGALIRILRQAAPFMSASWILTTLLIVGCLGGLWLDGRLGTKPWFLLLGLLLALIVGLYEVARVALGQRKDRS